VIHVVVKTDIMILESKYAANVIADVKLVKPMLIIVLLVKVPDKIPPNVHV